MKKYLLFGIIGTLVFTGVAFPSVGRAQTGFALEAQISFSLRSIVDQLTTIVQELTRRVTTPSAVTPPPPPVPPAEIPLLTPTFTPPSFRTLQFGDVSDSVSDLQRFLNITGHYPENLITGYYGRLTQTAVERFQQKQNIPVTGTIDELTVQQLTSVGASQPPKVYQPTSNITFTLDGQGNGEGYIETYIPGIGSKAYKYPSLELPISTVFTTSTVVNLGAAASPGSTFGEWTICNPFCGVVSTFSTSTQIEVNQDMTIIANFDPATSLTPTLSLSIVSGIGASPTTAEVSPVGIERGGFFDMKMTAQGEPINVRSIKLTMRSITDQPLHSNTLKNIRLYTVNPANLIARADKLDSCIRDICTVTFFDSSDAILTSVPFDGKRINILADIAPGGEATLGEHFRFEIVSTTDVEAFGAISGTRATVVGTPRVPGSIFIVPQLAFIEEIYPTTAVQVGSSAGQTVAVFKITNSGSAPIYLSPANITFTNGGYSRGNVSLKLYASANNGVRSDTTVSYSSSNAGGSSGVVSFDLSGVSEADKTINGGSWRYITFKTAAYAYENDTFQFSVSKLGDVIFDVKESDLGYSGNPSEDADLSDTIRWLWVDGKPSVATVTVKNGGTPNGNILSIKKNGTGTGWVGTVGATPTINCGFDCPNASAIYTTSTVITLRQDPNGTDTFSGWNVLYTPTGGQTGECRVLPSPTSDCTILMSSDKTVVAAFNGASPTTEIKLFTPNGGEILGLGKTQKIEWKTSNAPTDSYVNLISLYNENIGYTTIASGKFKPTDSFSWTIPTDARTCSQCFVVVYLVDSNGNDLTKDRSDGEFSIITSGASVNVTSPNGGEEWKVGSQYIISWTVNDSTVPVAAPNYYSGVSLVKANNEPALSLFLESVNHATRTEGKYAWTIPTYLSSGDYKIHVRTYNLTTGNLIGDDESDRSFSIVSETQPPIAAITVASPIAGSQYQPGWQLTIRWNFGSSLANSLRYIELLSGTGERLGISVDTSGLIGDGSYTWIIPDFIPTDQYKIRVGAQPQGSGTPYGDSEIFTISSLNPPQEADFTLSNGGSRSVYPGGVVSNTVTVLLLPERPPTIVSPVTFSASGLPAGATATFSPTSCSPTCATVMVIRLHVSPSGGGFGSTSIDALSSSLLSAASQSSVTVPSGTYTVTVRAGTTVKSKTTSFRLTVLPPLPLSSSVYDSMRQQLNEITVQLQQLLQLLR